MKQVIPDTNVQIGTVYNDVCYNGHFSSSNNLPYSRILEALTSVAERSGFNCYIELKDSSNKCAIICGIQPSVAISPV